MILTINTGSSSVRLAAFDHAGHPIDAAHHVGESLLADEILPEFLRCCASRTIECVAHRVVHGGPRLIAPTVVDAAVEAEIASLTPLAPAHQPRALGWIRACRDLLGEVTQVAVFDTAFFADLPAHAALYAIPLDVARRYGLRRYGFHGLAHRAMWERWRAGRPGATGLRAVTLQLGGGASAAAIADGRPLDTSMGFTPLEGLVMATRPGDVDPGVLLHLARDHAWSPTDLDRMLHHGSGLVGLAGSADLRELLARSDPDARLAIDMYCARARKYVGAYLALLGGADAVLVGGGAGERSPAIRGRILGGLGELGLALDARANDAAIGVAGRISAEGSRVEAWVLPVDEAVMLFQEARTLLAGGGR